MKSLHIPWYHSGRIKVDSYSETVLVDGRKYKQYLSGAWFQKGENWDDLDFEMETIEAIMEPNGIGLVRINDSWVIFHHIVSIDVKLKVKRETRREFRKQKADMARFAEERSTELADDPFQHLLIAALEESGHTERFELDRVNVGAHIKHPNAGSDIPRSKRIHIALWHVPRPGMSWKTTVFNGPANDSHQEDFETPQEAIVYLVRSADELGI